MCDRAKVGTVAGRVALVLMGLFLPAGLGQTTSLVSVTINGTGGNATSGTPSVSRDGRFVAFYSESNLMVPGDNNGFWDVFVRDRVPGTTVRVSVSSDGQQSNGRSIDTASSEDGRYVAFASEASNLIAGDTNGAFDIFVHDLLTGVTERVSVDSAGNQANGLSRYPAMSASGRYIAFQSLATNLASGDTNGTWDVFLRDRVTGTTTWVSAGGNNESKLPVVSDDGQVVAFESKASNLVAGDTNAVKDVFVCNLAAGTTERVSVATDGTQGNNESFAPAISADGVIVAFASGASNLVPGNTNGRWDVFVRDRAAGQTQRVSVDSQGVEGNHNSVAPAISDDGAFVAFASDASNLVAGDTNAQPDVFVHDRDPDGNGIFDEGNGQTVRASVDAQGQQLNSWSNWVSLSADGQAVAFYCGAYTHWQVLVGDLAAGTTTCVSANSAGELGNQNSRQPALSADGRYVAFTSAATNLDPADTNTTDHIYVHDRLNHTTALASLTNSGGLPDGACEYPALSADGRWLAFESVASNVVPGDTNGYADVFLRDLLAGVTLRASVGEYGEQANRDCVHPAISTDGDVTVYQSEAWTLTPDEINRGTNIFLQQRSDCVPPQFLTEPEGLDVPAGAQAVFFAIATGNPSPTFQWQKNGVPLMGETYRALVVDRASAPDAGAYSVVIHNALGSETSVAAILHVLHAGDVNCDGSVNFGDINPFVLYLSNFSTWQTTYPGCLPQNGDINGDGTYPSFGDINPFVALLTNGG